MIDIEKEHCIALAKAARLLPSIRGEKSPHPMTLYRWATKGLRSRSGKRVRLETTFIGGTRVTSKEALERFFLRKDDVEDVSVSLPNRMASRARSAKTVLKDFGIID